MLRLETISLVQFRNYVEKTFSFSERIIGICGQNGTGKTNLLDAVYYLSFSKSYFSRPDSQNVSHGKMGLRLEAQYVLQNKIQKLVCIVRENNRKELSLNEEMYQKFSNHIGKIPCVMIAPDDISIISGSSEERRKFLDTLLSQINKDYLTRLIAYTKILQQRNSLIKQQIESGKIDESLWQVLNEQLAENGQFIFEERKQFLSTFLALTDSIYKRISGNDDDILIKYESQLLQEKMIQLLRQSRDKDFLLQRTHTGIHKDDLIFQMHGHMFKSEASQGQRKSLLFALKLAEWQVLKEKKGFTPILLLDDVFEKLDEKRMYQLLDWVCTESDGQVFITDTHAERLQIQLGEIDIPYQLIELER